MNKVKKIQGNYFGIGCSEELTCLRGKSGSIYIYEEK